MQTWEMDCRSRGDAFRGMLGVAWGNGICIIPGIDEIDYLAVNGDR